MTTRNYRWCLLAIFLLAWTIRLGLAAKFIGLGAPPDPTDGLDQIDYEQFAFSMSQGDGYLLADGEPSARRAPGTSLLLLPVYLLFGRSWLAARVWITLLSALTCVSGAWVARLLFASAARDANRGGAEQPRTTGSVPAGTDFGQLAGLLTAALIAVNPANAYYSIHLWSEPPFGLFLTLACGLAIVAVQSASARNASHAPINTRMCSESAWRRMRYDLAAGLCWGAATLIRPQVVFCIPIAWCVGLWSRQSRRRWLPHLVLQTSLLLATLAPWVIRNAVTIEKPCLTTLLGGYTFWGAHNEIVLSNPELIGLWRFHGIDDAQHPLVGTEPQREAAAWRYAFEFVRTHVADLPRLTVWKLYRLWTPFEATPNRLVYWAFALSWLVMLPMIVIGCYAAFRTQCSAAMIVCLPIASLVLCATVFYGCVRFRHTVEPLFMVLAGIGAARLYCWSRQALHGLRAVRTTAAAPARITQPA